MATKLVTDGSVDLPSEVVEQYGIVVVPPLVIIDGHEYLSGVDISPTEFFQRQRTARTLPKTSQPSPGQYVAAFEEALKDHDRILSISLSSGVSGTFNSAKQAAAQFPPGTVILHDSLSMTGAAGFQVIAAARALAQGGTAEEALAAAQRTQKQTDFIFSVDDLTYLIKGGRIGKVAGAVGSLLNIRPIIMNDKEKGVFIPAARVRTFKASVQKMLDMVAEKVGEGKPGRFMLLYGELAGEPQATTDALHRRFDVRWFHALIPTPTLCAHTGPHALGLAFAPGDWE